jgi:hypothetical protein
MKTCLSCDKKMTDRYRVNEFGDMFCDDDCYEKYYQENDSNCTDHFHPYIDDYEAMRRVYFDWSDHWEEEIIERGKNIQWSVDDVLDLIDEAMEPYWDYYSKQGDDGVFAQEIYRYYTKFQHLQRKILKWRPERDVYYYMSFQLNHPLLENRWMLGEEFVAFLTSIQENEFANLLKDHVHPYDEMAFYFDTQEEAEKISRILDEKFGVDLDSIYIDKAYLCEGECYDIEPVDNINMDKLDGWFFCDSCESYFPGFFAKEELLQEIKLYETQPTRNEFYTRKIKRSCRYHDLGLPDWV